MARVAEFERALIREWTEAGGVAAKQRGVEFYHPRKLGKVQIAFIKKALSEDEVIKGVTAAFNVSRDTVYRIIS